MVATNARSRLLVLAAASIAAGSASAHHSSQAEFGPFASPTVDVEARIVDINWGNPHISMDLRNHGRRATGR